MSKDDFKAQKIVKKVDKSQWKLCAFCNNNALIFLKFKLRFENRNTGAQSLTLTLHRFDLSWTGFDFYCTALNLGLLVWFYLYCIHFYFSGLSLFVFQLGFNCTGSTFLYWFAVPVRPCCTGLTSIVPVKTTPTLTVPKVDKLFYQNEMNFSFDI